MGFVNDSSEAFFLALLKIDNLCKKMTFASLWKFSITPQDWITEIWSTKHAWFASLTSTDAKGILFYEILLWLIKFICVQCSFPQKILMKHQGVT